MFTPSKGVDCFCLFLITGLPEPSLTDKYKVGLRSFYISEPMPHSETESNIHKTKSKPKSSTSYGFSGIKISRLLHGKDTKHA